jgi:hypothetical protein
VVDSLPLLEGSKVAAPFLGILIYTCQRISWETRLGTRPTSSDPALLAELLDSLRATGDATLVQLVGVEGVLASIEGALSMGGHDIPGMNLTLHDMRIMLFARVGDGRSRKACSCNSEEFGKLDHVEQARNELVVSERLDSWPRRPGFISQSVVP